MLPESWTSFNPVRLIVGAGRVDELPTIVSGRTLIVTTRGATQRGLSTRVADGIGRDVLIHDAVRSNPTISDIDHAIDLFRDEQIDWIVGLGGGSAIDVAKVLSLGLAAPDLTIRDWLVSSKPWDAASPLPMVAIPTTAGTGSEVTPFATVWDGNAKRKHSVGTPILHPSVALVDPELTLSLPWNVTLSTGLDAYSQCFEAICNRYATPITTAIAERGLIAVPDALRILRDDPSSLAARTAMAVAALSSGLAISVTRTGLAHSISYPITAHLGVPHGLACGLALPGVLSFNAATDDGRLARVASLVGLTDAEAVAPFVLALYRDLEVPALLRSWIPDPAELLRFAPEMLTPGRSDNNVRPATASDLQHILNGTATWLAEVAGT